MLRDLFLKHAPAGRLPMLILRNMRWLFYDGIFAASSLAIINTFFTLYLEALGATNTQIGLMSSLTNLMLLVTVLPGAWLSERMGSRRKAVLWASSISRLFLLISVFLPFWFSGQAAVLPVIAARLIVDNFNLLGAPAWTSLSAEIVPMRYRGRYFAARNLAMNLSAMLTALAVGWLITSIGRPGGYQAAMGVSFTMGLLATLSYARIQEPPLEEGALPESYSPRALLATIKADPNLKNYSIFLLLWNGSINIAGPFFAIFLVRELKATAEIIGVLTMLATLTGLPATYLFGKLIDRWGGYKSQLLAGFMIPFLPWLWLLARTPWGTTVAYLYDGIAWSGYMLASFSFMLSLASPARLTRYNAIAQVMVALACTVGALLGGVMVSAWGYRTVFALSGAGRLLSMIYFARYVKEPGKPDPEMLEELAETPSISHPPVVPVASDEHP